MSDFQAKITVNTPFKSAVKWLNHFDQSSMNEATSFLIDKFREASMSGDEPDQKASVVEAAAKASKNPMATAEALILIAEDRYQAGRYKLALKGLKNAVTIYQSQESQKKTRASLHRLWVARWLYGWAAWKLHLNYTAYESWRRSQEDLEKLIQNSSDEGDSDKEKWYRDANSEMDIEFACRAEEVFTWLYNFPAQNIRVRKPGGKKDIDKLYVVNDIESEMYIIGASKMGDDLVKLRNRVIAEIKKAEEAQEKLEREVIGDFRAVRQVVVDILSALELRSDIDERSEALLECGLAMHQIRDHLSAANFLERAVSYYLPGSHQKAIARWMFGIMRVQPEAFDMRAFDSFHKSMDEIVELKQRAGTAGNKPLVDWYSNRLVILEKAMVKMRERAQFER